MDDSSLASPVDLVEVVTIPAELEPYRDAVSAALFYLAVGAAPAEEIPGGASKSSRIRISSGAVRYLDSLAVRFGSKRQAIIQSLAWVAAQEPARRALLANTVI